MKRKITFISRLAILTVGAGLALSSARGQDITGHDTVDNPHLRKATPNPSASAAAAAKQLSQKDQKFLSQIAAGGVQEVQDAQVAMKQGSATTKDIASRIANERSASNQELVALAKKKGLGLGTDKIKARSMGTSNYDKQYIYTTTHDVQEDLSLLQKAAQSSDDKDVKAWAAKTAPMVKGHLSLLKSAKGAGEAKAKE